jgi:hypothetical protein
MRNQCKDAYRSLLDSLIAWMTREDDPDEGVQTATATPKDGRLLLPVI